MCCAVCCLYVISPLPLRTIYHFPFRTHDSVKRGWQCLQKSHCTLRCCNDATRGTKHEAPRVASLIQMPALPLCSLCFLFHYIILSSSRVRDNKISALHKHEHTRSSGVAQSWLNSVRQSSRSLLSSQNSSSFATTLFYIRALIVIQLVKAPGNYSKYFQSRLLMKCHVEVPMYCVLKY